ncbi:DUF536 domain-containing protein [Lactococcus protaetiae]|uniref:DUF536 domain-containing protein n=1 Tax=Lactococcus protaetiae TaxID=2592653 RepID=A0A514Z6L0_9LACT|nr:DUF536 domain-containing protein [Lactococcus protaetiae]MCL2114015.1 DUF536 domain-containing protein [Streptococcaceae bacterium]QDK70228.1 DUF536 domain-containing protein [Lactococcus protaetiae]
MDDMETKTVSELAELFGVTRQAMNKRVKSLNAKFVEKNEKNITVVNKEGIHELEHLYGKVVTAEAEVVEKESASTVELSVKTDDATSAAYEMISALMKDKNAEIDRLNSQLESKDKQLSVKDEQIAEKDAQIKKQQELMEKALTDQKQFFTDLQESIKNVENKGFFGRLFGKK